MKPIVKLNTIADLCAAMGIKSKHPLIAVLDFSQMDVHMAADVRMSAGFYTLMFKNYGCGHVRYGRQALDFNDGSLVCIAPHQVLTIEQELEAPTDREGWGLYFHPDLLHGSALATTIDRYTFFAYEVSEALHLSDKEKLVLNDCVLKITTELDENIDTYSHALIVSTLELLLNYCMRFYSRQFITRAPINSGVVAKAERILKGHFRSTELQSRGLPTVKSLADQLHLSAGYLGDLLRKETGSNAQDLIHHHLIEEAKQRLRGSDDAVSEIAYSLGFEYPQYFSKLFKKKTGQTPAAFRNLN